jgi:type II secretory ATPase GspE/PulE/Tfp pilus assembly ATPase PilB-like protein
MRYRGAEIALAESPSWSRWPTHSTRWRCGRSNSPSAKRFSPAPEYRAISRAYKRLYGEGRSAIDRISDAAGERNDDDRDADLERLKDLASGVPVIRLVNALITRPIEMGASDIHFESRRKPTAPPLSGRRGAARDRAAAGAAQSL